MTAINIRTKSGMETMIRMEASEQELIEIMGKIQSETFLSLTDIRTHQTHLFATSQIESVQTYIRHDDEYLVWHDPIISLPPENTEVLVRLTGTETSLVAFIDENKKWSQPEINDNKYLWMYIPSIV